MRTVGQTGDTGRGQAARRRRAVVAFLAAALAISSVASAAVRLDDWAGYWTGAGKVYLSNGKTEQVKCVVTYKITGPQLRQNIRCASQGFSFNGTSELHVAQNGAVTGNWTENTYSAQGDVTGNAGEGNFKLAISGVTFTAVMTAAMTGCKQTLDIVPTGLEVTHIAIGLGKC